MVMDVEMQIIYLLMEKGVFGHGIQRYVICCEWKWEFLNIKFTSKKSKKHSNKGLKKQIPKEFRESYKLKS